MVNISQRIDAGGPRGRRGRHVIEVHLVLKCSERRRRRRRRERG